MPACARCDPLPPCRYLHQTPAAALAHWYHSGSLEAAQGAHRMAAAAANATTTGAALALHVLAEALPAPFSLHGAALAVIVIGLSCLWLLSGRGDDWARLPGPPPSSWLLGHLKEVQMRGGPPAGGIALLRDAGSSRRRHQPVAAAPRGGSAPSSCPRVCR